MSRSIQGVGSSDGQRCDLLSCRKHLLCENDGLVGCYVGRAIRAKEEQEFTTRVLNRRIFIVFFCLCASRRLESIDEETEFRESLGLCARAKMSRWALSVSNIH